MRVLQPPAATAGKKTSDGASGAASSIRSTPARRRWPPTSPSGPRPASSRPCRPRRRRSRPPRARPAGRTRRRRRWSRTRCAASRASTPPCPRRRPDLMRAAGRPQRRGRGRESPAAAAARGRRDAAIVALAFCAGLRRSEIAALVWGDITPTARAGQLRVRVRTSKANADGRREDLRLLAGPFARAVDALRAAEEPAATDRVVPLGDTCSSIRERIALSATTSDPGSRPGPRQPRRPSGSGRSPGRHRRSSTEQMERLGELDEAGRLRERRSGRSPSPTPGNLPER